MLEPTDYDKLRKILYDARDLTERLREEGGPIQLKDALDHIYTAVALVNVAKSCGR